MLGMRPYRVIMKAVSPAVIGTIAPSLDGILYEALSQALAVDSPDIILARLREIVLFNEALGVFHASSLTFAITPEQGVGAGSSIRSDRLNNGKLSSLMFRPSIYRGKLTAVMLKGGPTKIRLTSRHSYTAPWYSFDFIGIRETVLRLLTMAFVGVGYDVFSAANGAFSDVRVIPLDDDSSIAVNGMAMRPVPVIAGLQGRQGVSPLVPPYFGGEREAVIFPEPIRISLLSDLL